jgi:hypothetical protein
MRFPQVNFSKGEVGEELRARFDVQAYGSAALRARNVRVKKYGGLEKRPGTRFVSEVFDATKPVRLFPFQFSLSQTYALELGQGYMRVASNGGMVLNEELAVTGLTSASPVQVTTAFHGYSTGDQVYFSGQTGPWAVLNGRFWDVLASINDNNFTIDFDGTGFAAFTASTGGITRSGAPDPDPPAPVVPDPVEPPQPPDTGGGGGQGGGTCPSDDALWLMANEALDGPGAELPGRELLIGLHVWTQHETTLEWGAFAIERLDYSQAQVFVADILPQALHDIPVRPLFATADHPMRAPGGDWFLMASVGIPAGTARVVKATISSAHTMIVNGVLSHNKTAPGE